MLELTSTHAFNVEIKFVEMVLILGGIVGISFDRFAEKTQFAALGKSGNSLIKKEGNSQEVTLKFPVFSDRSSYLFFSFSCW